MTVRHISDDMSKRINTVSSSAVVSTANENPIYDISQVLNRQTISTADKHFILTHPFDPPANFNWPYEERLSKNKTERRYLRPEHLQKNAFLVLQGYWRP